MSINSSNILQRLFELIETNEWNKSDLLQQIETIPTNINSFLLGKTEMNKVVTQLLQYGCHLHYLMTGNSIEEIVQIISQRSIFKSTQPFPMPSDVKPSESIATPRTNSVESDENIVPNLMNRIAELEIELRIKSEMLDKYITAYKPDCRGINSGIPCNLANI